MPKPTISPLTSAINLKGCFENLNENINDLKCLPDGILTDGKVGPLQHPNGSMFFAWNKKSRTVQIQMVYRSNIQIRHVNIFFYNIPTVHVGLPDVSISVDGLNRITYLTNNQHLSSEDNMRRNVSLSFENHLIVGNIFDITFTFNDDSNVDWLLLSELQLCLQPSNGMVVLYFWSILISFM